MFGIKKEDIIGKTDYEVDLMEPPETIREKDKKLVSGNNKILIEFKKYRSKGKEIEVYEHKSHIADGEVDFIIASIQDVTEQNKLALVVQESEDILFEILDNLPISVALKDVDKGFKYILWNKQMESILGKSKEKVIGHSDFEIFGDKNGKLYRAIDEKTVKDGSCRYQDKFLLDTGQEFISVVYKKHLSFKSSNLLIMARLNITELIQAQAKLDYMNKQLQMSLMLGNIAPMIWDIKDDNIKFTISDFKKINPGFTSNEDGISFDFFIQNIHPEDAENVKNQLLKIKSNEQNEAHFEIRFDIRGIFDNYYDMYWKGVETDENGNISLAVGIIQNTTKIKNIFSDLKLAKEKAENSDKMKTAFLANMSHEIRTPLNAIVGFSEMLSTTESKEEKKDFQEIISRNCSLLLQLINDILDLSKIESGTLTMQFSKFTISSVCLQVLSTIQFKVDKSIVELKSELNFDCILESDRNKVTQVISNFLTNAIKFTPNGSITIRTDEVEGRKLEVSVIDTGIGIPEDKQKIVFERFIKLNTFVQGTGLGLPICKIIMDNLGGEIGVDSEIGVGSRFWFRLPYAEKIQVVEKTDSTEPEVKEDEIDEKKITIQEKLTSHAKRCKVLAAEDDDNNYQLLYFLLKKHFDITRANNGKEAVDLFNDVKPDIVLMDIKMPVMDGFEATQLIRKIDKQIPIIAITAYAYDSDINKAIKAGCNDFITKPIKIDLLLKKLMQC